MKNTIIAGTDPYGDEVPMVIAHPEETSDPDSEPLLVPTDIFYAEITEEMDEDGNGIYGEPVDCVDYKFEFIVGRIPIYGKNVKDADKILARTVGFIKEKPSAAAYRRRIFFPTTISYYEKQDFQEYMPKMDGAYIAEYLLDNSIEEPFSSKLLVEKSGIDPSEFTEEDALTYDSMLENMNNGYGAVFWQAHGESTYAVRTIWQNDNNNNGIAEIYNYEVFSDTFVDNDLAGRIKAVNPFVFQASCLNGTIENDDSLAYNILKNTAVGVVGASQVSYGMIFSGYDLGYQDIFAYGTVFTDAVLKNEYPAEVFFETKEKWSEQGALLTIKLETNYIGDPSLKLNVQTCGSDSDCDDAVFCNGFEKCVDGFCEKEPGSVPCLDSAECEESICDEASKSCKTSFLPDGSFCGKPENACIGAKQCLSGKCTDVDLKECSELDSECSAGTCDSESGECVSVAANEGGSCTTADGNEGYCGSGECLPKKQPEPEKSSSSGCSISVF